MTEFQFNCIYLNVNHDSIEIMERNEEVEAEVKCGSLYVPPQGFLKVIQYNLNTQQNSSVILKSRKNCSENLKFQTILVL